MTCRFICTLTLLLLFAPHQSVAQTARNDAASRISQLAQALYDPAPDEEDQTGPGWTLYPPLGTASGTVNAHLDHCILTIDLQTQPLFDASYTVDLTVTSLPQNETGHHYYYIPSPDETRHNGAVQLVANPGFTIEVVATATPFFDVADGPQITTSTHQEVIVYFDLISSEAALASFINAIITYQSDFCQIAS